MACIVNALIDQRNIGKKGCQKIFSSDINIEKCVYLYLLKTFSLGLINFRRGILLVYFLIELAAAEKPGRYGYADKIDTETPAESQPAGVTKGRVNQPGTHCLDYLG